MRDALVLAHGAFHGPWCWQPTVEQLEKHDVHCVAVDLNRGGLAKDRDALQAEVDALRADGYRVLAMGHSLGCASVGALDPSTLATVILLAGSVADHAELPPTTELIADGFMEKLQLQDDGRAILPREIARGTFYQRCTQEEAEWALDQLRPTFVYGAWETDPPIWQALPLTYIACTDDQAVRPEYQTAVAAKMPFSKILDWDHSPMLGQGEVLAAAILEAMSRAD